MKEFIQSTLKKALGGKISSKTLKKSKHAASKAIKAKIEGRRKEGEKSALKRGTGNYLFD